MIYSDRQGFKVICYPAELATSGEIWGFGGDPKPKQKKRPTVYV